MASNAAAEGIRCWISCHHPPKITSATDLPCLLRASENARLGWFARTSGVVTTYLGKMLGIQGWRDYHLLGTVKSRVVHAARSTDFLYTIDLRIEQLWVGGKPVTLAVGSKFIRAEVFPFVRMGTLLPVRENDEVCVSGELMWDGDGFLEIHPKKRTDFLESQCK